MLISIKDEFFIRKAIGWVLRQYARTDPEWVRSFVKKYEDKLSPLSKREALKHISKASRDSDSEEEVDEDEEEDDDEDSS